MGGGAGGGTPQRPAGATPQTRPAAATHGPVHPGSLVETSPADGALPGEAAPGRHSPPDYGPKALGDITCGAGGCERAPPPREQGPAGPRSSAGRRPEPPPRLPVWREQPLPGHFHHPPQGLLRTRTRGRLRPAGARAGAGALGRPRAGGEAGRTVALRPAPGPEP